jgi:hypothetical protein
MKPFQQLISELDFCTNNPDKEDPCEGPLVHYMWKGSDPPSMIEIRCKKHYDAIENKEEYPVLTQEEYDYLFIVIQ